MDRDLLRLLACPVDFELLEESGDGHLTCRHGHKYAVVKGIPILLRSDVPVTHGMMAQSLQSAATGQVESWWPDAPVAGVDPLVQQVVSATSGYLYKDLIGKLREYPIPEIRLPWGNNARLLDVGCNWGRWSVAAARRGYDVVGVDPDIEAVRAAIRVSQQLGVSAKFVVGDARYLPFREATFDRVFSYSVLQHLSKEDVRRALLQVRRILAPYGESLIQMPNGLGIRSMYHQVRRGFRIRNTFDVRYWTPRELTRTFEALIGPSTISVDGFLGLGIQPSDAGLLPRRYKAVIQVSETGRRLSERMPRVGMFADSLYLTSRPRRTPEPFEASTGESSAAK